MENNLRTDKKFLETNQYSEEGIKKYEFIFGENFISSGGLEGTSKILSDIHLNPDSKVLDVGSGLGGGCKFINEKYGAYAYGIDISESMVDIAKKRFMGNEKIEFEAVDVLIKDFPENSFDMIYSRDTILHFSREDKKKLFEKCYAWLKPKGIILITDYCASKRENWDEEFKEYVKQRRYTLTTVEEYKDLLTSCKFTNVTGKDISDLWLELLQMERKKLEDKKEEFLKKFSENDYKTLQQGWDRKIKDSKRKIQIWGYFKANKC